MLARKATVDTYTRMFHFKITHNILYLNKALAQMGLVQSARCSYCNAADETVEHLFSICMHTKRLWEQMQIKFTQLELPDLTPQSAIVGLAHEDPLVIHLHLMFKICLYKSREQKTCSIVYIVNKIKQIKKIEHLITASCPRKKLIIETNGPE